MTILFPPVCCLSTSGTASATQWMSGGCEKKRSLSLSRVAAKASFEVLVWGWQNERGALFPGRPHGMMADQDSSQQRNTVASVQDLSRITAAVNLAEGTAKLSLADLARLGGKSWPPCSRAPCEPVCLLRPGIPLHTLTVSSALPRQRKIHGQREGVLFCVSAGNNGTV